MTKLTDERLRELRRAWEQRPPQQFVLVAREGLALLDEVERLREELRGMILNYKATLESPDDQ